MTGVRKAVSSASGAVSFRTWGTHVHYAAPFRHFLAIVFSFSVVFFGLGNYLAARQNASSERRMAAMRAEIDMLRQRELPEIAGLAGRGKGTAVSMMDVESRAALVADVKRQLRRRWACCRSRC